MKQRLMIIARVYSSQIKAVLDSAMITAGGSVAYVVTAINTNGELWTNLTAFVTLIGVTLRLVLLVIDTIKERRKRKAVDQRKVNQENQ